MLIHAERELEVSQIKHRTLLNEYVHLAGFEQCGNGSPGAQALQVLLKNNRQIMAQQRRTYEIKRKYSAFLQSAHDVKETYKIVKECVKQARGVKVPKIESSRKMGQKMLKKQALLESINDNMQGLSEMLDEISVDDCVSEQEDLALQNELAAYRVEMLKTLLPTPLGEVRLDSTVFSQTGATENATEGSNCE